MRDEQSGDLQSSGFMNLGKQRPDVHARRKALELLHTAFLVRDFARVRKQPNQALFLASAACALFAHGTHVRFKSTYALLWIRTRTTSNLTNCSTKDENRN